MTVQQLNRELGQIDLFLLDLLLKGKISEKSTILDAGCGEGRNMTYFIRNDYSIFGIDNNASALKMARMHAKTIATDFPAEHFIESPLEKMPFENEYFNFIFCISALHFASNYDHFMEMITDLLRTLKTGGRIMIKMDSTIGIQNDIEPVGQNLYRLPDQSVRFLLTEQLIKDIRDLFSLGLSEGPFIELHPGTRSQMILVLNKK